MIPTDKAREYAHEGISRFRDRRRGFRRACEDIFDRQTFVTLLFLGPAGKAIELWTLGKPAIAARFVFLAVLGLGVGIYWRRLSAAAAAAADAVEDAANPDDS